MKRVAILTSDEAVRIKGEKLDKSYYANPVKDGEGRWVISEEEINACMFEPHKTFLQSLPLIEYKKCQK